MAPASSRSRSSGGGSASGCATSIGEIEQVRTQRHQQRTGRRRAELETAAIVGYTNAGKSTLLNALTGASVRAEHKLFATLDPTTRRLDLPAGRRAAADRHRRLHPEAADRPGGRLPGDARGGDRGRPRHPGAGRELAGGGGAGDDGGGGAGRARRGRQAAGRGAEQGRPPGAGRPPACVAALAARYPGAGADLGHAGAPASTTCWRRSTTRAGARRSALEILVPVRQRGRARDPAQDRRGGADRVRRRGHPGLGLGAAPRRGPLRALQRCAAASGTSGSRRGRRRPG